MNETFSVWWFDPDGNSNLEMEGLTAEDAVSLVKSMLQRRPARVLGIFSRIIIVDVWDFAVFEWVKDKGITFPTGVKDEKVI